uniref:ATP-dependent RNA helicase n=1 Tax=Schistocephalus solidus TaxID=70667 RepID=A0A0V0J755_SCHSO
MNSAVADAQRIRKEDVVIGGFTLVRDKQRYTKPQVKEVLPHWISSPVTCSSDLSKGIRVKKSALLEKFLVKNLRSMGIKRLFPVQSTVIPYILDFYAGRAPLFFGHPRDICISAPTGSGKTLAYALPIVQLLNSSSVHVIRAVVILPVRDLAKQAEETFKRLIASTSLRVTY